MKRKSVVLCAVCCVLMGNWFGLQQSENAMVATVATAEQGIALPIIMYHSILKDPAQANDYVLSPAVLAQDLDALQAQGYTTVTIADLLDYVQNGTALPEKPVMITFDDGFYNNYLYAYPLLAERGMQAVISVLGEQMEAFTASGQVNAYWSYVSSDVVLEMVQSGVFEVQNHSYSMHENEPRVGCLQMQGETVQTYAEQLLQDTMRAQALFVDMGLPAPTCYTYPLGAYSEESEALLQQMGFLATLSCNEGMNYITRDPNCLYLLKRYNRPSGVSTASFLQSMGIL